MNDDLNRALIDAAWRNDLDDVARLIEQGADVNAKDETVQSAYLDRDERGVSLVAGIDTASMGPMSTRRTVSTAPG